MSQRIKLNEIPIYFWMFACALLIAYRMPHALFFLMWLVAIPLFWVCFPADKKAASIDRYGKIGAFLVMVFTATCATALFGTMAYFFYS